jgi:hypothetical protein
MHTKPAALSFCDDGSPRLIRATKPPRSPALAPTG